MDKYKVKVIGQKAKLRYRNRYYFGYYQIDKEYKDKEDHVFWEGEIDQPKLETGDKIYIDSETIYSITDVARDVNGGFVCWTDEILEIEDEETVMSKIKAEMEKESKDKEREEREKREREELEGELRADGKSKKGGKKWYHLFK